ncbi:glycoside hydrolase family 3 protein [Roseateles violae]|uniref:Glycoside hydrolase family 3 N-terminal domain-containing protein n=1 Tax=Roseateles violae TaxID=3058042 RepID=A0ABT8E065_9BURK|nr:glycoside hydrolase family 3 protein [Pelomonas sp. PFR6]MDN3923185.1 glycoside hydrolase family 3 N-terminal domain-containing protein [Pelomonas sp. PFR6]
MNAKFQARRRRPGFPSASSFSLLLLAIVPAVAATPDWPSRPAPRPDPALEARIEKLLAGMSLAQKVGQMTQPEIKSITPAEVTRYSIGSVLNGGGTWPGNNKQAGVGDWLALAKAYHQASLAAPGGIPLIWGTDAVHGHNNVLGATLFPHNIGLGASGDAALVEEIAAATAKAVRSTGIRWVFAPTIAVARDARWGRTYESFSENPALVARLGAAHVRGLQGQLKGDANVVATAKHFIGDGGTELGRDQGVNRSDRAELMAVHGQGYLAALDAGAQTVMASFNSWHEEAAGVGYGKLHGSHALLTGLLKERLGFDGLLVSDWNGIGQVQGCSNASCPQAIKAGIDMVMVPEDWRAFIANTIAEVERGEIPQARIDDAVRRILRVKLRAGLFDKAPGEGVWDGKAEALQARELARRAARQTLVLLKNNGGVLPLTRGKRILVVGKSADSLPNQAGGWTLTWQGTENRSSDFPAATTILAGLREFGELQFSETAEGVDVRRFDAVIAVIGETPYAEGHGDIPASGTLQHSSRYPEDLAVLKKVSGQGVPVVTVFLSGRTVYANDLINLSDAFVAAWLPGSEGGGVADLLFRGAPSYDFTARLPFAWPAAICPGKTRPLFALGYGLSYAGKPASVPRLPVQQSSGGCAAATEMGIFVKSNQPPYQLQVGSLDGSWPEAALGGDLNASLGYPSEAAPRVSVSTVQINTQQDARRVVWQGPARLFAGSAQKAALQTYPNGALVFDTVVEQAPSASVRLAMGCGAGCAGMLELGDVLRRLGVGKRSTVKVPLSCFAAAGAELSRIEQPFSLAADAPFTAAFANIRVQAGAALDADALKCSQLKLQR